MKRVLYLIATVLLISVLAACGGGDEAFPKTPDEPEKAGRTAPGGEGEAELPVVADEARAMDTYVQATCAGCHADDMSGNNGPALTAVGSKYSAEEIHTIIKEGKGIMPGGLAKGEDAANLAAYLATLKGE